MGKRTPIIVCDGEEDVEGRVLTLISALHQLGTELSRFTLRFIRVTTPRVHLALDLLEWESGLVLERYDDRPPDLRALFEGATLFVAVQFSRFDLLPLGVAHECRVPTFTVAQFPLAPSLSPRIAALSLAANDPSVLANEIVRVVGSTV